MPVVQCEEDHLTEGNYDLSFFMTFNFDDPEKQTELILVEKAVATVLVYSQKNTSQVARGLGFAIFCTEQLSPSEGKDLLFQSFRGRGFFCCCS